jgi:tetratricopeptide (TPR) repeat protein
MTAQDKTNPPPQRPILLSPRLVIFGALLLYGFTLNHWVSLSSLPLMSQVTGWDWHPYSLAWHSKPMAPLFLVLTFPARLLPVAWQPAALNIFTALCAALTLGLLARSVRLLPQDRTREQRLRELGAHSLLSLRASFLPVFFAVLILATQLTFWENAIVATGEMLNLLVFAFVINCLLEYRISHNDKWLLVSAFTYALGATNNWALLGFFPLYLMAVLWIRGLAGFFNGQFLARMFGCGLAGLSLYLLIPFLGSGRGTHEDFWILLHQELAAQTLGLRFLVPHWVVLVAAVPTILPLIFAAIRWPSFEGEVSAAGNILTRWMFSVMHVAFLALALVTFFDFKFSPSVRMREQPVSFLTFYYSGALCVGYFSGYMLLVFGTIKLLAWERQSSLARLVSFLLVVAVWVLALGAPVVLACGTFPRIRAGSSHVLQQFARLTLDGLPSKKSIVLSDDAARLFLLQAECERRGLRNEHILIDTESFAHRDYILYLVGQYPELRSVVTTNLDRLPLVLPSDNLARFMARVTQNYPVYYLHPSFGYYFEALYLQPRGLVYELKRYTTNMTQPPLVTDAEIKVNQAFWANLNADNGPLRRLPELAKQDADAGAVSVDYSVALDYWGTELQKANHLKEAHQQFAEAVRLNSYNFIAGINLEYNERLQKGDHRPIDSADTLEKALYFYHGLLVPLLRRNGPADEPGLDLQLGEAFALGRNFGQAAILFRRRLELLPDDAEAQLAMAKTYTDVRQPDKALDLIHKLRVSSRLSPWELTRCEASAYMVKGDFATAEKVLRAAVQADPNDENRVATLADYYRVRGLGYLDARQEGEAVRAFTNALTNIDLQLKLLASSKRDAPPKFDVAETLLNKAEIQIKLRSYADAINTLGQVLQLQPSSYLALLNRAVSEIQLKQFQAARDDFKAMGKLLPDQEYLAEFGLADVAAAEKNDSEQIDHLKRCVRSAPQESSEYRRATNRLAALMRH